MAAVVNRETYRLPRAVAPDLEIFAVGDIHGRTDLLHALLDEAAREPKRRERRAIVFLGDLVDRGPDSLGAIDLAIGAGERIGADEQIALMGNHETMMRLAVDPKTPWDDALDALGAWLRNGGAASVRQFADFEVAPEGPEELLTVIRVALPGRVRSRTGSTCGSSGGPPADLPALARFAPGFTRVPRAGTPACPPRRPQRPQHRRRRAACR